MQRRQLLGCGILAALGCTLSVSTFSVPKVSPLDIKCNTEQSKLRRKPKVGSWAMTNLTYHMIGRDLEDMDALVWDIEWIKAFRAWSDVSPLSFDYNPNYKTANILIDVGNSPEENFGEEGGVLAWAQLPPKKKWKGQLLTKFDLAETWVQELMKPVDPESEEEDKGTVLRAVAAHEIGHLVGLHHSRYFGALMYPYYNPEITIPQFVDDIIRINSIYKK